MFISLTLFLLYIKLDEKMNTHTLEERRLKAESLMLFVLICLVGLVASDMLVINTDFMVVRSVS